MPTVTLNRKIVDTLLGKKLSDEKLKDRISMLGTDLEKLDDKEIIVEVFPHRPDMLSEQGFTRALSSFLGIKKGLREYNAIKSDYRVIIDKSLKRIRPFTACAVVKGLKLDDANIEEIINIQEKLHITFGRNRKKVAIGVYPFEKIKMPIKFLALEPSKIRFKPLDSNKEMNANEILEKHKAGREYGYLLDGLDKFPVFLDGNNKVLSMPPIINSEDVGRITNKTKDIFVECSGSDFEVMSRCLNILVCAFADMGGKIYSMQLEYPGYKKITPELKHQEMKLDVNYVNKLLDLKLKEKNLKELLEKMGHSYKNGRVIIPAYRVDILHSMDLVEDIAIAYGYENFDPQIPNIATIGEENDFEKFKSKVANFLIGFGLNEVSTYHLSNKKEQCENTLLNINCIEVEKAKSGDYNVLRFWMIPSLLTV